MDSHVIIDWLLKGLFGIGAFVMGVLNHRVNKLESAYTDMPKEYVRKDDYREDTKRVFELLEKIDSKLDRKQDK